MGAPLRVDPGGQSLGGQACQATAGPRQDGTVLTWTHLAGIAAAPGLRQSRTRLSWVLKPGSCMPSAESSCAGMVNPNMPCPLTTPTGADCCQFAGPRESDRCAQSCSHCAGNPLHRPLPRCMHLSLPQRRDVRQLQNDPPLAAAALPKACQCLRSLKNMARSQTTPSRGCSRHLWCCSHAAGMPL